MHNLYAFCEQDGFPVLSHKKQTMLIDHSINCKTRGVPYVVECKKCPNRPQYIGKTKRSLRERGREHITQVEKRKADRNERSGASKMYTHFSSNGHGTQDMLIYAIEQSFGDDFMQQARERMFITRADTIRKGLNTYRT